MNSLAVKIYQFYTELFGSGQQKINLNINFNLNFLSSVLLFNTKLANVPE